MQTAIAILILIGIAALMVWFWFLDRRMSKRRALLSKEERDALEREDAIWSQTFSF